MRLHPSSVKGPAAGLSARRGLLLRLAALGTGVLTVAGIWAAASAGAVPIAGADAFGTNEDTALNSPAPGVLANDVASDSGGPLSAALVSDPSHGTVTLLADGSFSYQPAPDFHGTDSFTYRVNDGVADSEPVEVTITVAPVNDPPTTGAEAYEVPAGGSLEVDAAAGVLANDLDPDGDVLSAMLIAGTSHGALMLAADGSFTYTPDDGYVGPDSFRYAADDGEGSLSVRPVAIEVLDAADLVLGGSVDESGAAPDELVTFTLTLLNDGPGAATGASVVVALPAGLTLISSTPSTGTFGSGTWTIGDVVDEATATLVLTASVATDATPGASLELVATATADSLDSDPDNNAVTLPVLVEEAEGDSQESDEEGDEATQESVELPAACSEEGGHPGLHGLCNAFANASERGRETLAWVIEKHAEKDHPGRGGRHADDEEINNDSDAEAAGLLVDDDDAEDDRDHEADDLNEDDEPSEQPPEHSKERGRGHGRAHHEHGERGD